VTPPTIPQLVRFRARLSRAMDHLEKASWEALDALRAYDGDKLPVRFDAAMAWETAHSAEQAIPALKALIASALTDVEETLKAARTQPTSAPGGSADVGQQSNPQHKPPG
jgi:hypothetical protein